MSLIKIRKFIPDAEAARSRSKDRSTRVGAIAIDNDYNIRSSGYNGFVRGIDDDIECRHERPTKYLWTAHAEENCIAQAARIGVSIKGCTLLVTDLFPCSTCARLIIQSGIIRVVAPTHPSNNRWNDQAKVSQEMFSEAGVEVNFYG